MADEEAKAVLSPLRWRFGDSNMQCEDCGSEVWVFKEGRICSGCGREEPEPEEKPEYPAVAMPADLRQRYEHASSILSDDLGLCGCGHAEASYALVRTLLGLTPFYEHQDAIEALLPDAASRHIVLSSLDSAGLVEHGTSIGGSWITSKGTFFLGVLREVGDDWDVLHEVGLPHDGTDCTDACWAEGVRDA